MIHLIKKIEFKLVRDNIWIFHIISEKKIRETPNNTSNFSGLSWRGFGLFLATVTCYNFIVC